MKLKIITIVGVMISAFFMGTNNIDSDNSVGVISSRSVFHGNIANQQAGRTNTARDTKQVPQISRSINYTTYQATAYTWTGNRTSSGQYPVEGQTIAINPAKFKLGQRIYIVGHGWRIAEDIIPPESVEKGADIDLYMGRGAKAVQEAKEHGRKYLRVYK